MSDTLVNKIANSGLITLKPEEWFQGADIRSFDLRDHLFMGMILKEKDFRDAVKAHDWSIYQGSILCVFCSADAIIPNWAYMLVASRVAGKAEEVFFGTPAQWKTQFLVKYISSMDITPYTDQRVIIKGCSDELEIGPEIYTALTVRLVPIVKSLMFGEPCSTVPVYKRPKDAS